MEYEDETEEQGFFQRYRTLIFVGGALLIVGLGVFLFIPKGEKKPTQPPAITMVQIAPPPPPPKPTPVPTPPPPREETPPEPDQQMIEQEPVPQEDVAEAAPESDDPPDEPLGTGIKGDGAPDGFGLGTRGSGRIGGGGGSRGGSGSKYGRYAAMVQNRIAEAMRRHPKTKNASLRVEVRIWPDNTGRITRAQLNSSTGNPSLDAALQNEILNGLRLQEPPPEDMPRPIVLRLTARQPNSF